jgi:hypothetical protein
MISATNTWKQASELGQLSDAVKTRIKRYLQLASVDKRFFAGVTILALFLGLYFISHGGRHERGGEIVTGVALLIIGGVLGYGAYLGEKVREEMNSFPQARRPILAKLMGDQCLKSPVSAHAPISDGYPPQALDGYPPQDPEGRRF